MSEYTSEQISNILKVQTALHTLEKKLEGQPTKFQKVLKGNAAEVNIIHQHLNKSNNESITEEDLKNDLKNVKDSLKKTEENLKPVLIENMKSSLKEVNSLIETTIKGNQHFNDIINTDMTNSNENENQEIIQKQNAELRTLVSQEKIPGASVDKFKYEIDGQGIIDHPAIAGNSAIDQLRTNAENLKTFFSNTETGADLGDGIRAVIENDQSLSINSLVKYGERLQGMEDGIKSSDSKDDEQKADKQEAYKFSSDEDLEKFKFYQQTVFLAQISHLWNAQKETLEDEKVQNTEQEIKDQIKEKNQLAFSNEIDWDLLQSKTQEVPIRGFMNLAIQNGKLAMLTNLLDNFEGKVNLTYQARLGESADTLLGFAIRNNQPEIVKYLITRGADVFLINKNKINIDPAMQEKTSLALVLLVENEEDRSKIQNAICDGLQERLEQQYRLHMKDDNAILPQELKNEISQIKKLMENATNLSPELQNRYKNLEKLMEKPALMNISKNKINQLITITQQYIKDLGGNNLNSNRAAKKQQKIDAANQLLNILQESDGTQESPAPSNIEKIINFQNTFNAQRTTLAQHRNKAKRFVTDATENFIDAVNKLLGRESKAKSTASHRNLFFASKGGKMVSNVEKILTDDTPAPTRPK
jgi:hypothetical protein